MSMYKTTNFKVVINVKIIKTNQRINLNIEWKHG